MSANHQIFRDVCGISETVNLMFDAADAPEDSMLAFKATNAKDQTPGQRLQKELAKELPAALKDICPTNKWELKWGPVVSESSHDPRFIGNIAYIASGYVRFDDGHEHNALVVAIGAIPDSMEMLVKGLNISSVIDIDKWIGSGHDGLKKEPTPIENDPSKLPTGRAYTAYGFGQGLFRLINLKMPSEKQKVQTLFEYVHEQATQLLRPKIIFTGHSVGGTLACLFAYTLAKAGGLDSDILKNLYVYPTGAPSPWNRTFVDDFTELFPSSQGQKGYHHWNVNIVNLADIIPYAFCTDRSQTLNLHKVPSIYKPSTSDSSTLEIIEESVRYLDESAKNLYYPLNFSEFESPVPKPPIAPRSIISFLFCAGQQHVSAYKAFILGPQSNP